MRMQNPTNPIHPEQWGLDVLNDGRLAMQGAALSDLATSFGTPLHVLDIDHLRRNCLDASLALFAEYAGPSRVHYAMKANSTPAVAAIVRSEGLGIEIMTEYELRAARHAGFSGADIIVNGPCKSREFLCACIEAEVKAVVIDSLTELERLIELANVAGRKVPVMLRINPDYVPRGMNRGSAMSSRRGSPFGLDLASGEVNLALERCGPAAAIDFVGFHLHIGTGIRHADEHGRALERIMQIVRQTMKSGLNIRLIDVGGGFGVGTTRGFTSLEMLRYQATGRLPRLSGDGVPPLRESIRAIAEIIYREFPWADLPELIIEPGRSIVSDAQLLLLTVHYIKHRPQAGTWYITDGGLGTVSMPTWYEYHEVFACDRPRAERSQRVHIVGPGCFAGDVVYRSKLMPPMTEGEVLAVMDSGAYFVALESNFSHPRPAIIGIESGIPRLLRRREDFDDMTSRDLIFTSGEVPCYSQS